jgi:tRNA A37 threonylcarbamoyladenosine modification protein TsaB
VIGFSSLDVISRAVEDKRETTLFVIDTKRGDFYGQVGESGEPALWSEEAKLSLVS